MSDYGDVLDESDHTRIKRVFHKIPDFFFKEPPLTQNFMLKNSNDWDWNTGHYHVFRLILNSFLCQVEETGRFGANKTRIISLYL